MNKNIIVFLGPSLSLEEARQILPEAWYHSPIECGDILRIMRLKSDCIVIIDGYYEQRAAVWHKEILYALEQGIPVIGASSMGALRAAELKHFGMIGVGKIFEDYYQGRLTDDDEVAVLHGPRESGYAPLNDALVNIRATIAKAIQDHVITAQQGEAIIDSAKKLHYPQRTVVNACKVLAMDYSSLLNWMESGNAVNQKKLDAAVALQFVRDRFPEKLIIREKTYRTTFVRELLNYANATAFNEVYDFLPAAEKNLIFLRDQHPKKYKLVHDLAQLFSIVYDLAINTENINNEDIQDAQIKPCIAHYLQDQTLTPIYRYLAHLLNQQTEITEQLTRFMRWVRLIYLKNYYLENDMDAFVFQYALIWLCLDALTKVLELRISIDDVQAKTTLFMQNHQINTMDELGKFIEGDVLMDELNDMLMTNAYLEIIFKDRNYDFLLPKKHLDNINWLEKSSTTVFFFALM